MAALILISGSNDSGKSLFAEKLAARTPGERYYIATMKPVTEENHRRIKKHRDQRSSLGFTTLELPYSLDSAAQIKENSVVLLEDVSNLLANVIFEKGGCAEDVFNEICKLQNRCTLLIAVTISGLSGESGESGGNDNYDEGTMNYINQLNNINKMLLDRADAAVKMSSGIPIFEKGDINDII